MFRIMLRADCCGSADNSAPLVQLIVLFDLYYYILCKMFTKSWPLNVELLEHIYCHFELSEACFWRARYSAIGTRYYYYFRTPIL